MEVPCPWRWPPNCCHFTSLEEALLWYQRENKGSFLPFTPNPLWLKSLKDFQVLKNNNSRQQQLSACAAVSSVAQSCPTLCDPRDGSPPGSPVPGIIQARTLEWLAISFSNAGKWKVKVKLLRLSTWKLYNRVQLLAIPWTAVHQAPPSIGFSRQEYWSGVPLPSPTCPIAWPEKEEIPFYFSFAESFF